MASEAIAVRNIFLASATVISGFPDISRTSASSGHL
jgi:hypothetical protein